MAGCAISVADSDRAHSSIAAAFSLTEEARLPALPVTCSIETAVSVIEAAICSLAIRDGWAPASVNLETSEPELAELLPGLLRTGRDGTYRRVLSTSFGFGGLNAALVFGGVD